jgi:AraC family transcriptional regulator
VLDVTDVRRSSREDYRVRLGKVLEYIEEHTAEALPVERLSRVAGFSPFHFHRQFAALIGTGVHGYVQLVRMRRAAHTLGCHPFRSVLDVALDAGYESPEGFARAFKRHFRRTPSAFQRAPDWSGWAQLYERLKVVRSQYMKVTYEPSDVTIVTFVETTVAALEHRGAPYLINDSVRRFVRWRREVGLPPRVSKTFNVFWDNPDTTEPGHYRMDICASTTQEVSENDLGIVEKVIPGGRCAVLRHIGPDPLDASIHYLYRDWLPRSGETLRDFPLFAQRVVFPPEVPEHESVVDVFLPVT